MDFDTELVTRRIAQDDMSDAEFRVVAAHATQVVIQLRQQIHRMCDQSDAISCNRKSLAMRHRASK